MLKDAKDSVIETTGIASGSIASLAGASDKDKTVVENIAKSVVGALPETALEVAPFIASAPSKVIKTAKEITKSTKTISKSVEKLLSEAAPSADKLRSEAQKIYSIAFVLFGRVYWWWWGSTWVSPLNTNDSGPQRSSSLHFRTWRPDGETSTTREPLRH